MATITAKDPLTHGHTFCVGVVRAGAGASSVVQCGTLQSRPRTAEDGRLNATGESTRRRWLTRRCRHGWSQCKRALRPTHATYVETFEKRACLFIPVDEACLLQLPWRRMG